MAPVALAQEPGHLAPRRGADPGLFVEELERELAPAAARLAEPRPRAPAVLPGIMAAALREEIEASEVAALWMPGEFDLELKLAFARLCGDGARHYRLLAERLEAQGTRLDPLARGHSPLFRYLKGLETPAERLAAGAFARQGLAPARSAALAQLCQAHGDLETAQLYREVIGPEAAEHHQLGRKLLARFAVTPEDQERARRALARTLQLVAAARV